MTINSHYFFVISNNINIFILMNFINLKIRTNTWQRYNL